MYASLDRADLAVEDDEGRKWAIQTEHRDADEIEQERDLAFVFALTRTINPLRSDAFDGVRFTFLSEPHAMMSEILERAGAELEVFDNGEQTLRPRSHERDDAATDLTAAACLQRLGSQTLRTYGVSADEAGLRKLQTLFYSQVTASEGVEEDPVSWWGAVVELGAATGEVIRAMHGGEWQRDTQNMSTVPFVFGRDNSMTNVFDKVERFFARGESEAPTFLLQIMADESAEMGRIIFNLRPPDWGGRDFAFCNPLVDSVDDGPLVALVHDLPNTTRSISKDIQPDEVERLQAQALENVRGIEVQTDELDAGGHTVLSVHGDYYASEKLLDPDFMQGLAARLGAEMLCAAVPRKGVLFVTTAMQSSEAAGMLMAVAHGQHEDAPPNEQLSSRVFLVSAEGLVVGVAQFGEPEPDDEDVLPAAVDESDPEPPTTSFWARLFGG